MNRFMDSMRQGLPCESSGVPARARFARLLCLLVLVQLTRGQLDALVLGLPWQRIGEAGVITLV